MSGWSRASDIDAGALRTALSAVRRQPPPLSLFDMLARKRWLYQHRQ